MKKVAKHERTTFHTSQGCRVDVRTILERDGSGLFEPVLQEITLSVPEEEDPDTLERKR